MTAPEGQLWGGGVPEPVQQLVGMFLLVQFRDSGFHLAPSLAFAVLSIFTLATVCIRRVDCFGLHQSKPSIEAMQIPWPYRNWRWLAASSAEV